MQQQQQQHYGTAAGEVMVAAAAGVAASRAAVRRRDSAHTAALSCSGGEPGHVFACVVACDASTTKAAFCLFVRFSNHLTVLHRCP
jgi:hypothetical protein